MSRVFAAQASRARRPPAGQCPSCRSSDLTLILEQRFVPVHTSTLLASRAEALAYPRAEIRLAVCRACGLFTNTAFDAPNHDYSASYEEVQSYSPRFRAYASELAETLVERHSLIGHKVLEIGAGRADFLLEVCARTGAPGYAVDPSFREHRLEGVAGERITVERAFFAADHVPDGVGAVLCRHTLEHVHDVGGFLRALRLGLEKHAREAVVVFEVPDTLRVLRETAFWDIYYEHCTYFTPGSLARAFRAAGLCPDRLELAFDGQYIVITATADGTGSADLLPLEERPAEVVELALGFAERLDQARVVWANSLASVRKHDGTAVIWGAGSKGVGFLCALGLADEIACAVDVNPEKHGMFIPGSGHQIVAPEELKKIRPSLVIVMNPAYVDEIRRHLAELEVAAEVLTP